jgi:hypothetical protein
MKSLIENKNFSKFKIFMKTKDTNNIKKIYKSGITMNKMFKFNYYYVNFTYFINIF